MAAVRVALTALYLVCVLGLGLYSLWPRLFPRFTPVENAQGLTASPAVIPPASNDGGAASRPSPAGPVSLNRATLEELDRLPGVGPAIARRIIEGRPYGTVEDLLRVQGIGERTLERLRPLVVP